MFCGCFACGHLCCFSTLLSYTYAPPRFTFMNYQLGAMESTTLMINESIIYRVPWRSLRAPGPTSLILFPRSTFLSSCRRFLRLKPFQQHPCCAFSPFSAFERTTFITTSNHLARRQSVPQPSLHHLLSLVGWWVLFSTVCALQMTPLQNVCADDVGLLRGLYRAFFH